MGTLLTATVYTHSSVHKPHFRVIILKLHLIVEIILLLLQFVIIISKNIFFHTPRALIIEQEIWLNVILCFGLDVFKLWNGLNFQIGCFELSD